MWLNNLTHLVILHIAIKSIYIYIIYIYIYMYIYVCIYIYMYIAVRSIGKLAATGPLRLLLDFWSGFT